MDNFKDYVDKFKDTKKSDDGVDTNEKADFATVDGSGGDTNSEDSNWSGFDPDSWDPDRKATCKDEDEEIPVNGYGDIETCKKHCCTRTTCSGGYKHWLVWNLLRGCSYLIFFVYHNGQNKYNVDVLNTY